jgi:hypothetical protein
VQIAKLAISIDQFVGGLVLVIRDGFFDSPIRFTSTYIDNVDSAVLVLHC